MRSDGKNWLGIILVAIGILLIADNFLFFDFDIRHVIFSWHTVFLIIGLVILNNSKNNIAGIGFVVIGAFGILGHIQPFDIDFSFRDYWPVLLIIIGFFILFRRREIQTPTQKINAEQEKSEGNTAYTEDLVYESTLFSSVNRIIDSQNFKGGKVSTIFGGSKINLAKSKLAPGENILEISCLFGGCEIIVPKDWKIIVNVSAVFGGFDNKRQFINVPASEEGILIIKGTVVFGGGEILSY